MTEIITNPTPRIDMTATHRLRCRHCRQTNNCTEYTMRCNILKTMPDGRLKIEVFGERFWKRDAEKRSIRYVEASRVYKALEQ